MISSALADSGLGTFLLAGYVSTMERIPNLTVLLVITLNAVDNSRLLFCLIIFPRNIRKFKSPECLS